MEEPIAARICSYEHRPDNTFRVVKLRPVGQAQIAIALRVSQDSEAIVRVPRSETRQRYGRRPSRGRQTEIKAEVSAKARSRDTEVRTEIKAETARWEVATNQVDRENLILKVEDFRMRLIVKLN